MTQVDRSARGSWGSHPRSGAGRAAPSRGGGGSPPARTTGTHHPATTTARARSSHLNARSRPAHRLALRDLIVHRGAEPLRPVIADDTVRVGGCSKSANANVVGELRFRPATPPTPGNGFASCTRSRSSTSPSGHRPLCMIARPAPRAGTSASFVVAVCRIISRVVSNSLPGSPAALIATSYGPAFQLHARRGRLEVAVPVQLVDDAQRRDRTIPGGHPPRTPRSSTRRRPVASLIRRSPSCASRFAAAAAAQHEPSA